MIEELEDHFTGVTCLRCGMRTPLQVPTHWGQSDAAGREFHSPVIIVRCFGCGKESSYLADEVVAFKTMSSPFRSAA
jgi:hypothetical protein